MPQIKRSRSLRGGNLMSLITYQPISCVFKTCLSRIRIAELKCKQKTSADMED